MDLTWPKDDRPFQMLPDTAPWSGNETPVYSDWRVRHLAAAFLWESLATPGHYHVTSGERRDIASCAGVLDWDPPASPKLWHHLVRHWLRPRLPNYRAARQTIHNQPTSLPLCMAVLNRSRRHKGLANLLWWLEVRNPAACPYKARWPTPEHQPNRSLLINIDRPDWRSPRMAALVRDVYPERKADIRVRSDTARRPRRLDPNWLTDTVVALARQMWERREYSAMPILADALQDAGCDRAKVLTHCRDADALHCRGCWVLDLVLKGANWRPRSGGHLGVRNGDGEALTHCAAVVGHAGVYDVCLREAGDPLRNWSEYLSAAELDTRFPGWRAVANPVHADPSPPDADEPQAEETEEADGAEASATELAGR